LETQAEPASPITNGQRSIVAAAAPIAFCVLVIDAVVETYVSGSSVRWFLLTVATTALIILLYRLHHSQKQALNQSRFARPRVLFLLGLGLIALTAWLPGGVTGGIRILGQSTSTVLSVVTLGATVAAGAYLLRLSWRRRWIPFAIGLLTAYAAFGFLKGISVGTAYPHLLKGESFWKAMPWLLQGSTIGGLLIATATIYSGAQSARPATTPERELMLRTIGLGTALLIVVAGIKVPAVIGPYRMSFSKTGADLGPVIFAQGESRDGPNGESNRFSAGVQNVYAFFSVEKLNSNDAVRLVWFKGGDELSETSKNVAELRAGHQSKLVWTRQEFPSGAAVGGYFVEIDVNDRLAAEASFVVNPR
jgi:hypothetical protein